MAYTLHINKLQASWKGIVRCSHQPPPGCGRVGPTGAGLPTQLAANQPPWALAEALSRVPKSGA